MKNRVLMLSVAALAIGMAGTAWADGDAAAGEALAKKCAACHGADGKGKKDNPNIVGLSTADFIKDMHDFASGKRESKAMGATSKKLSEDDIENLAAYYASLK